MCISQANSSSALADHHYKDWGWCTIICMSRFLDHTSEITQHRLRFGAFILLMQLSEARQQVLQHKTERHTGLIGLSWGSFCMHKITHGDILFPWSWTLSQLHPGHPHVPKRVEAWKGIDRQNKGRPSAASSLDWLLFTQSLSSPSTLFSGQF